MTLTALRARLEQPVRFALVGLVNSAAGLAVIYAAKFLGGFGDVAANILGYAVGLVISFALNSAWTFRYRGPKLAAAGRFLVVFAVAYLANLATVIGLVSSGTVNGYVAQACGIPVYTICFYLLSRAYAFRESR